MDMPAAEALVAVACPCLITVEKGIFTPRLPSYRRLVAGKHREIRVLGFLDLPDQNEEKYGLRGSPTQVERIFPPPPQPGYEIWRGDADSLAARLHEKLREKKFLETRE
jgi:electron transfer flavoprotein beta subunit